MNIVYTPKKDNEVTFDKLKIGQTFISDDDFLCIKTSIERSSANCIVAVASGWIEDSLDDYSLVTPVNSTLTVEHDNPK